MPSCTFQCFRQSSSRWSFAARGLHDLDCTHCAFAAGGAFGDIDAGDPEQRFLPRLSLLLRLVMLGASQKLPTSFEFLPAAPVPQQTVMPDLDESVGQDMKQEPPDELIDLKGRDLAFVVVGVVAPPERNFVVIELHEPVVADRDPVSVSAEIFKNAFCPVERRLTVDDPLLLVQIGDEGFENSRRRKIAYGAGVYKFVLCTELFQMREKLSPKEFRHDLDGKEKAILA